MEKLVGRNVGNSINLSYGRFYSKQNQKKSAGNPSWLWSLLACRLGTVRTVRLFSLANHSCCPHLRLRSRRLLRCPVPPLDRALFSLAASTARRRSKLFSLAEHDRWSLRYRIPYCSRPIFSRLSASSSRLPGPPAWNRPTSVDPNPRVACRSFSSVPSFRFSVVLVSSSFWTVVFRNRKRKDQFLEALFRASLVGASRLKVKGRPARLASSASIGNKNKTHKRSSKVI